MSMENCRNQKGMTLMELVVATAILAILASAVLPLSQGAVRRSRELELRRNLRILRSAIDDYKMDFDRAVEEKKIIPSLTETGYPKSLEVLVEGKDWKGLYPYKRKYLRRIPKDPFDEYGEGWGLRSYREDPESTIYGGEDVYDLYSQSIKTALDGTLYKDW
ncbi:type II secretion system pseudopilin PulG [Syntrophotalea carbinolica DSM 2380]|uniref:Type II secretion system pseudopilin PulG n=1 Tax=Syntrophotalea carbinolica (strain DSM 2380 / NBRC 103641 / GraBd1) TaxID=338963 RepID=Q3A893_SYNC1|nr:type II secretion system protein [Syntrophotalea carbinolica]ABA87399.1 type II secretion system pseudopilin PulG [Syntrophotalea carbinolica DSM 2380]